MDDEDLVVAVPARLWQHGPLPEPRERTRQVERQSRRLGRLRRESSGWDGHRPLPRLRRSSGGGSVAQLLGVVTPRSEPTGQQPVERLLGRGGASSPDSRRKSAAWTVSSVTFSRSRPCRVPCASTPLWPVSRWGSRPATDHRTGFEQNPSQAVVLGKRTARPGQPQRGGQKQRLLEAGPCWFGLGGKLARLSEETRMRVPPLSVKESGGIAFLLFTGKWTA